MNFFSNNQIIEKSEIKLLLSLLSGGCNYDQARVILNLKKPSLSELTASYFGSSAKIYHQIRKYLSDEQCLRLWLTLKEMKVKDIDQLLKQCLYPFFLIITSFMSLIFFRAIFIPRVKTLFGTETGIDEIFHLDMMILFLVTVFIAIIMLTIILWISLNHPDIQNFMYLKLHDKFKDNLLTVYSTSKFAHILSECFNLGIATQSSLDVASMFQNDPFVVLLAHRCISKLQSGQSFTQAILSVETDKSFRVFIQMGLYSNQVTKYLNNYIHFSKLHIKRTYSKMVYVLFVFAYTQFILSAYLLYQIIQIPLHIISNKF